MGALLFAGVATAQSEATLEAVRLHKPTALELARADLARCVERGEGQPACNDAARLSLLVGYLLLSEGQAKEAAAQLASRASPPSLEPFHAFYLGQAQFYSGAPAAAAKSFERAGKSAPGWMQARLRSRQGEALLAAGDAVRAAPLLEKAALERATAELYWQRAMARRAVGNENGERADLRTLALRFPAHPYGEAALERLLGLKGKLRFSPSFDERIARARALLSAGEPRAALDELGRAEKERLARGGSAVARLALLRAQALLAIFDEPEAERQLDLALKGPAAVAAEALMMRARRAMRQDNARGRELMGEVDARFPKEAPAADAAYLAGWLDLQGGRYEDAAKAFEEFDRKHPTSKKRDEAMWFRALAFIRAERYGEAVTVLEQLRTTFPRTSLAPQARYWIVRAQQLSAKGKKAPGIEEGYRAVLEAHSGSFYALLSAERLRELGVEPRSPFPSPPKRLDEKPPPELKLALALAAAGLFRDASEEVQARLAGVRGPDKALKFGHALQGLGEFGHAHSLAARQLWAAAYGAKEPTALALMYPRAFQAGVERHARSHSVDPYLMWAIMRRESGFRPEVASAADARGLMQVIPPTANAVAQALKLEPPSPGELFSPELNLELASWYLSALAKRFAHPALIAAAYNAGPKAVARWAKEKSSLPLDVWVEEIPYKETRGYVKSVTADYFVYSSLYATAPFRLSLTVPAPGEGVDF